MKSIESAPGGPSTQIDESSEAFLPVTTTAKRLRVSPMTIRRLFDAGEIPGYRYNRTRLILRSFVDGFVALVEAGAQPEFGEYASAWFERAAENAAPLSMAVFNPNTPGTLITGERGAA
jgi:excisionase family DNA binding protein